MTTCQDLTKDRYRLNNLETLANSQNSQVDALDARVDALEAGSASVEGSYTTWTINALYDTDFALGGNEQISVTNDGTVYLNDWTGKNTHVISSAGALLNTLDGDIRGIGGAMCWVRSLLARYYLHKNFAETEISVVEGTAELWSRLLSLDDGAYTLAANPLALASISPSGEWIAVLAEQNNGEGLVMIYQGS